MPRRNILFSLIIPALIMASPAWAQGEGCPKAERACILDLLGKEAAAIDNADWRDQTYRELAKTLAFDGRANEAIALVDKITNPDTKAMTIRGIGMATADLKLPQEKNDAVWKALHDAAVKIDHKPSHAIALTYIAMSQAFAGDNEAAWATAAGMENEALRHKAYAETAEIQAERGDLAAAIKSIEFIGQLSFRNKSYQTVSKILADRKMFDESLQAALKIDNAYKKAEAMQYILDKQKPREVPHE